MSDTVDSPRAQSTRISLNSAWVSVMDLFGGIFLFFLVLDECLSGSTLL
jgi:hypothetical protein